MPQAWGYFHKGKAFEQKVKLRRPLCCSPKMGVGREWEREEDTTALTSRAICAFSWEMWHKGKPTKCPSCEEMLALILRWQKSIMHKSNANPQETRAPFLPALKELMVVCFKYVLLTHNSSLHTTYYSQRLIGRCTLMLAHSSHASHLPITQDLSLRTAHKEWFAI